MLFSTFLSGTPGLLMAQDTEDKILIADKEELYIYEPNKSGGIQVRSEHKINYRCIKPETVSFVDFYDGSSEVKNVRIKGIKGVTPQYSMYKRENVFFSDSKACYFMIPFIQKGSQAEVTLNKVYRDIRRFNFLPLAESHRTGSKTVRFVVPDWMKVELLLRNGSDKIRRDSIRDESKKLTTHIFRITDLQGVVTEEDSPDYMHSHPYLIIVPRESSVNGKNTTYFASVGDLYRWYKSALGNHQERPATIKDRSLQLTESCADEVQKIRELSRWVQQNIRYISFQAGIAAFRPDSAHEVMAKKYGDCKGMSNLLKALLVEAGFDARLAWVATKSNRINEPFIQTPVPFADHMICALFRKDSLYYIDPTIKSLSFGEIPEHIQGQKALIEDGDEYIISQIPELNPESNRDSLFVRFTITNGKLAGRGHRSLRGTSKHSILYWLDNVRESDKKTWLEELLQNGELQDSVTNIEAKGLDSFLPEVSIDYDIASRSGIHVYGNQTYVNLNHSKDYQNAKIDIPKRKTAWELPNKDNVVSISELRIPDGYALKRLPPKVGITREKYAFEISYNKEEDKVICSKEIVIFDPILEKDDFEQWNSDIDTLRKAYNELVVLETPTR